MSARYGELSRRITELRNGLLPSKFSPTGLYSDRVYDRTLGFRLLAHAEFEAFIEDRAYDVANEAIKAYEATGRIRPSLLAISAYSEKVFLGPTSLLRPPQKQAPLLIDRAKFARDELTNYIRNMNNGIKEKNLLRILLAVGVESSELDMIWLNDVETWATLRGDTAHQSGKVKTRPDPRGEYSRVLSISSGFSDIDKILDRK
ncbi:HEPN domain-containing protein [Streptacidiphilus sp. N1-12]|uniref:HEPN domain-containing protein n=2 Tax=Streptacidiphilus alkalitolerans TaxID=3342712 RepID=A0ABV6V917_9ACTN